MYCRYENRGYCELNKKECVPASKGCIIKVASGVTLIDDIKRPSRINEASKKPKKLNP